MKLIFTRIALLSLLLSFVTPSMLCAFQERRTALVIGNSSYNFGRLKNPVNDATDMSEALEKLGFRVILKENVRKREMIEAINEFGNKLKGGGVGLFYYAGHAVQVDGDNYLIPINAKVKDKEDIETEAVDLGRILTKMNTAKNNMNIVILDACRDNPFPGVSRSMTRSLGAKTRGLAVIPTTPTGTIISYATAAGQAAMDGEERNSPYTASLLKHIQEPGLSIEQFFKKVRNSLAKLTGGKQIPAEYTNLNGDFYFNPGQTGDNSPLRYVAPKVENRDPEDEASRIVQNDGYTEPVKMKKIRAVKTPGYWIVTDPRYDTKKWAPPVYEDKLVPDN